jgi:CheY-like chemotaxis protein
VIAFPTPREVLLLSAAPEAHAARVTSLRQRGTIVRVANRPEDALALLRRSPELVLVDLVHGPGLDRRVVSALNRARRGMRVVALHRGSLDAFRDQVEHLSVDGFYRLADWTPEAPASLPDLGADSVVLN